jgi:hypothetical protein
MHVCFGRVVVVCHGLLAGHWCHQWLVCLACWRLLKLDLIRFCYGKRMLSKCCSYTFATCVEYY